MFQDFLFSLNHNGFLFLGSSESLGASSKYFRELDPKWKIFRSISTVKQVPKRLREDRFPSGFSPRMIEEARGFVRHRYKENPESSYYQFLSKRFSPASIFLDRNLNILFINGDAGQLLQHREGTFENNLLKMIRSELETVIRNGIRKADKEKTDVRITEVITEKENREISIDLTISKLPQEEEEIGTYLIHFSEESVPQQPVNVIQNVPPDEISQQRFNDLEDELKTTKAELQNVVEELETSNEELQSSNEELMASNEELQSTNEELQSVNEELYTVNSEVQEKNKELVSLNNDVNNLFESTEIGTLFLDRELNIRKFTSPLTHHFSLTENDLGRPIHGFSSSFGEEIKLRILQQSRESLDSLRTFEEELVDVNGNYFLCRISPFVTLDKMIDGVVITFVNISDLKSKEKALAESHAELLKAQEIARLGSWSLDTKSGQVIWSEELFKMFGLKPGTVPPTVEEQERWFMPDSWAKLTKTLEHTLATGDPYEIELKLKKDTDEEVWVWASGAAEHNEQGEIVRLRGIAQDITQNKNLRQDLLSQMRFSERISELSPAGIFVINSSDQSFQFLNNQCSRIFGYSEAEMKSLSSKEVFNRVYPDDLQSLKNSLSTVVEEGKKVQVDFQYRKPDGSDIWCHTIICPFEKDTQDITSSYIGVVSDVTDQKVSESQLNDSMKAAKAASIYKDQFLANMSHEIRTPLNGLVGFADLLRDDPLDPVEKNHYLDIIEGCSNQLLNLIDDILDLSKIEAGELQLDIRNCDLYKMIRESLDTFEKLKEQKEKDHIRLVVSVPEDCRNLNIVTDPLRLQQVLTNLISNAIKFSDDGQIEFGYYLNDNYVEFFVRDEGIGISEERISKVFERFEHLDGGGRKYEGTGLGLSVSKGIVELLGGSISLDSVLGEGSTFKFRIPYRVAQASKTSEANAPTSTPRSLKGLKLLLVEDEYVNITYYRALFKKLEVDFVLAEDGRSAVDLFRANPNFDVILMDIQMPVLSGDKAIKEILAIDKDAKVIAQTAYAMSDDEKKYLGMGFADYISKPIDVDLLLKKIRALAPKSE